jgi:quinol-cytochrome oxidoreductase complex cytochrome b subunit/cytochrome c551/c552
VKHDQRTANLLATSAAGLFALVGSQLVVGVALGTKYRSNVGADPYSNVSAMRMEPIWRFLADFHYWGSQVLIVVAGLHVALMLWYGWYQSPHVARWFGTLCLFASALLFQITGNLLPAARHDVQTAVIEGSIGSRVPIVGELVRQTIYQGQQFGPQTIDAWYVIHRFVLPLVLVLGTVASMVTHFRRRDAHENKLLMWIPLLGSLVLSIFLRAPFGAAATVRDYNTYDAKSGWYVWPMHGLLRAAEALSPSLGWIGSMAYPGFIAAFLIALPWLSRRVEATTVKLTFVILVSVPVMCALAFGDSPAPIIGDQDPPLRITNTVAKQTPIDAQLAAKGRDLFKVNGCDGCHGKDGGKGTAGPTLTRIYEEHAEPGWYVGFIRNPKSVNKGSTMPSYDLPEADLKALAEFLRGLR